MLFTHLLNDTVQCILGLSGKENGLCSNLYKISLIKYCNYGKLLSGVMFIAILSFILGIQFFQSNFKRLGHLLAKCSQGLWPKYIYLHLTLGRNCVDEGILVACKKKKVSARF